MRCLYEDQNFHGVLDDYKKNTFRLEFSRCGRQLFRKKTFTDDKNDDDKKYFQGVLDDYEKTLLDQNFLGVVDNYLKKTCTDDNKYFLGVVDNCFKKT